MARYGFGGGRTDMKIFILYVMRHVLDPVALDDLGEMVLIDDNMNYFLFSECVSDLVGSGLLLKETGKTGNVYTLTPRGFDTLEPVERTLPVSLRRAVEKSIPMVLERLHRATVAQTELFDRNGDPMVRLTLTDGKDTILSLELMTAGLEQSRSICVNFRQHPELVFSSVLRALTDPPKQKEDTKQDGPPSSDRQ